jgi:cation transport ATPase
MDKFNELTTGAKLVLGATIVFLIVSFFNWYEADLGGLEEVAGIDAGVSMWNGVGVIAGLIAIVLLVWQAIRLANIDLEIGVTPAMITAALALLLLIFTVIRVIDGYEFADRTIWLWIGLVLAIVIAVGAWMNMQASGESLADIRASMAGAAAAAKGAVDRKDEPGPSATGSATAAEDTSPPPPSAPDVEGTSPPSAPAAEDTAPDDTPKAS